MYRYLYFWTPGINCIHLFDFKCKEWLILSYFSEFSEKDNYILSDFNFFKVNEYMM